MNSTFKTVAALAVLVGSVPALAEETAGSDTSFGQTMADAFATDWSKDFSVSVGTKLWFNTWNTWNPEVFATVDRQGNVIDVNRGIGSYTSGDRLTPIPVVSAKWKDLFVSGSYFTQTDYSFQGLAPATNYQWDVNLGYYVLPPYLALTVGYKDVHQSFGSMDFDFNGPTLGFVGAVPMKWGFSLYTNFAYGFFELQQKGFSDRNSAYWLIEGGVAYTYNLKELWADSLLNSATITAGYRQQQIETSDLVRNLNSPSLYYSRNTGNDIMRGMVVGVNLTW